MNIQQKMLKKIVSAVTINYLKLNITRLENNLEFYAIDLPEFIDFDNGYVTALKKEIEYLKNELKNANG